MDSPNAPLFVLDGVGEVVTWSEEAARLLGPPGAGVARAVAASGLLLHALPSGPPDALTWEFRPQPEPEGRPAGLERALVDSLLHESQLGLLVLDTDLRLVRVSSAARAMHGPPGARVLGRRLDEAYALADPAAQLRAARELLRTGRPVFSRMVTTAPPEAARRQHFSVSAFRLRHPDGRVLGIAMTLLDVTRRERDRERALTVGRVRERVGRSLDVVETCEALADALYADFADIVVVALPEEVIGGDDPPAAPYDTDRLLLRQVATRAPAGTEPFPGPEGLDAVRQESVYVRALRERRPVLVRAAREGTRLADDPDRDARLRALGAHGVLVSSLIVRDRLLGMVALVRRGASDRFTLSDVRALERVRTHAALCLDNARRATHDRALASTVRRRLVGRRPDEQLGVDTAFVALSPLPQSGSWFDVLPLSGGRCALVTGEVRRSGPSSLTLMGQLRTALRALADLELQPDELLARLSDTVTHLAGELPPLADGQERTVNCAYALYDPVARTVTVAVAGRPGPLLVGPDGVLDQVSEASGPALGALDPAPFAMAVREAADGSTLVLPNRDLEGELRPEVLGRSLKACDSAQDLADHLFIRLAPHGGRSGTALLARTRGLGPDRTVSWDLPGEETDAARAREHVREWLAGRLPAHSHDDVECTELLVSELVTNAVRYGVPPVTLRLILNRSLTVEVTDSGTAAPSLRHARVTDEGGRGLFIVARLTDKWGTRRGPRGKTIWAQQPLGAPHP